MGLDMIEGHRRGKRFIEWNRQVCEKEALVNIRIYHAWILTMREGEEKPISGEIWVEDGILTCVGQVSSGKKMPKWDRQIDAKYNLVMPGFKNAHTHSAMTFLRSYADDLPLDQWLKNQVFPMEAKLTQEDAYHLCKLAIMEYLSSGITANFDMYFYPDDCLQASVDCGFRTVRCGEINGTEQVLEEKLQYLEDTYSKWNKKSPLISAQLGFHAEYTTCQVIMEGVSKLSRKYHAPVYMHNSETEKEVKECWKRHGMSPTQLMETMGMFEYGGGGFHCVWLDEKDREIFRKRNLYVIACPGSNMKLASGIAPLSEYGDMGIPMALGTDGPASNNCLDMFREMFLATGLQKIRTRDAAAMDANKIIQMATVGGAKAMGLTQSDCLAKGKWADLIMVDLFTPNMQPRNHIVKNIVYSGSKSNIRMTMVAGKILYENGEYFIGEDPTTVYENANKIIQRMKGAVS